MGIHIVSKTRDVQQRRMVQRIHRDGILMLIVVKLWSEAAPASGKHTKKQWKIMGNITIFDG